jgi:hypothetical protein
MTDLDHPQPAFLAALRLELSRITREEAQATQRRARRFGRRRTLVLAVTGLLALAGGAGATGLVPLPELIHPNGAPAPQSGPAFAPHDAVGGFDPALVSTVSVLERARTDADDMGDAGRYVAGSGSPGSSLRITAPEPPNSPHASVSTLRAWLVPTTTGAVSMQALSPGATGPGSGFAADAQMVVHGRAYMTVDDDLLGLAPDGVDSVLVTLRDGSTVELPVVANVFGAHFDMPVAGVRLGSG